MTWARLRLALAPGVVRVAGRSPVFICAMSMLCRDDGLRAREERQQRVEELARLLDHRQVSAALDDPDFRLREHRFRVREMPDRKDRILAAPHHQHWTPVATRSGHPGVP